MDKATLNDKGGLDFDDAQDNKSSHEADHEIASAINDIFWNRPDNKSVSLSAIFDGHHDDDCAIDVTGEGYPCICWVKDAKDAKAAIAALYESVVPEKPSNELIQAALQNGKPQQAASYNGCAAAINKIHANFKQIREGK